MTYTIEISDELDEFEWADMKDELVLAFEDLGDLLEVEGSNVGWTRDRKTIWVESHNAWRLLWLDDCRVVAEVAEDEIVVQRYSHDEPMGATFKFRKATEVEAV